MNLFTYISSLFGYNKIENPKSKKSDENSITFSIDGFHRPWISIELVNTDEKSCEIFAKMLMEINSAGYEQSILDLIIKLSKDKPSLSPALEAVLISWGMMLATQTNEPTDKAAKNTKNRPFIRPRNVFLGSDK